MHSNGVMDTNNMCMVMSTLIVSYLMDKFKFSTMYYGMIHGIILQLILYILSKNFDTFDTTYVKYSLYLIIIVVVPICLYYMRKSLYENIKKKDYLQINICTSGNIDIFTQYVTKNKKYFDVTINTNIGDLDKLCECRLYPDTLMTSTKNIDTVSKMHDVEIKFDDKFLGIKGYYVWKKTNKQLKDKDQNVIKDLVFKYVEINIIKENQKVIDPEIIFDQMTVFVTNANKDNVRLKYIKILHTSGKEMCNHDVEFYNGNKQKFEVLETKYMKSFFHPERDRLWAIIKNCCLNYDFYRDCGQVGRVSLLLHGPPGTGKSSFAYRIAMILQRHIISLDLRFLDKQKIYQILQKPSSEYCKSYRDTIYLFEEFDISIKDLHYREQKHQKMETKYYDTIDKYLGNDEFFDVGLPNNTNAQDKKNTQNSYYETSKSDFTLGDLLEIFQGPIPYEGMVMIASTNKYDEIKEICPALFRPGRITPVHFGYIDKETLQDISKYFFGKKIGSYIPDRITIPTSQIIDLALESKHIGEKPYEYFCENLEKIFRANNI